MPNTFGQTNNVEGERSAFGGQESHITVWQEPNQFLLVLHHPLINKLKFGHFLEWIRSTNHQFRHTHIFTHFCCTFSPSNSTKKYITYCFHVPVQPFQRKMRNRRTEQLRQELARVQPIPRNIDSSWSICQQKNGLNYLKLTTTN